MEKAAVGVSSYHLNSFCTHVIESAATYAASRFHYEVTIEHVLIKLLEAHGGDCEQIWRYFKVDQSELRQIILHAIARLRVGNQSKPTFSPHLTDWLNQAWTINSHFYHEPAIRSAMLVDTLIEISESLSFLQNSTVLENISLEKLRRNSHDILRHSSESKHSLVRFSHNTIEEHNQSNQIITNDLSRALFDVLAKIRNDPLNPVVARHLEIHQLINILSRQNRHHPLIIGESGVGKTSVINGLVMRICSGDIPHYFENIRVMQLDKRFLQVNQNYLDQLKTIITTLKANDQKAILIIDDVHELFNNDGANNNQLLNYLAFEMSSHNLQFILSTTHTNYHKLFIHHTEFIKNMHLTQIQQPTVEAAIMMLNSQRELLQKNYHILVTDEAVATAVYLSQRYINHRYLPEKAITVLDAAAALAHNSQVSSPLRIEEFKGHIACLEQRLENIYAELRNGITGREKVLGAIQTELDEKNTEVAMIQQQWQREKEIVDTIHQNRQQLQNMISSRSEAEMLELKVATLLAQEELVELQGENPIVHIEVNKNTVADVIAEWVDIPRVTLQQIINNNSNLIHRLARDILNQDDALNYIVQNFEIKYLRLINKSLPLGAFLFAGPPGVGKTITAHVLARELFGSENLLMTIDLKLYHHAKSISAFQKQLITLREQREYGIILCEDIDKAHPVILQILCDVFQNGYFCKEGGEKINFQQTLFILTTTLLREETSKLTATSSFGNSSLTALDPPGARNNSNFYSDRCDEQLSDYQEVCDKINNQLCCYLPHSLLANVNVVAYRSLDRTALTKIVSQKLQKIIYDLQQQRQIIFQCNSSIVNFLTEECAKYDAGAWFINAVIEEKLLPAIAKQLLNNSDENISVKILTAAVDESGNTQVEWREQHNNLNNNTQVEGQWHRGTTHAEKSLLSADSFELGFD